jgi:hypothetical protein
MAKANPLKSEGSAIQADGMLAVYEVTKILLGHGADGSVRRAYHRETGTHRSCPRRTGQPLAPAIEVLGSRHPATGNPGQVAASELLGS